MELDTLNGAGPCNSNPLELAIIVEHQIPEASDRAVTSGEGARTGKENQRKQHISFANLIDPSP